MATLRRQRGMTLVVVLMMLLVVMVLTVTTVNSGTTNLRVTGNMVARNESMAAAQAVIDRTISSMAFTVDPAAVSASQNPIDIDADGTPEYFPRLVPAPSCPQARPIKTTELDVGSADDVACFTSGTVANSGVDTAGAAATAGSSLCADTEWNIRAAVTDARTGTEVAINQGIGVRVLATDAEDFCK